MCFKNSYPQYLCNFNPWSLRIGRSICEIKFLQKHDLAKIKTSELLMANSLLTREFESLTSVYMVVFVLKKVVLTWWLISIFAPDIDQWVLDSFLFILRNYVLAASPRSCSCFDFGIYLISVFIWLFVFKLFVKLLTTRLKLNLKRS